jgi:hypothetical protein
MNLNAGKVGGSPEGGLIMSARGLVSNAALVLGAGLIVVSGLFTLTHLTDRVVLTILVPGFVVGLLLIGVYWAFGSQRRRRSE